MCSLLTKWPDSPMKCSIPLQVHCKHLEINKGLGYMSIRYYPDINHTRTVQQYNYPYGKVSKYSIVLKNNFYTLYIGKGHNETFRAVEELLRERYPDHILPSSQTEWIFVNAGGWMGAMYLLHASLTEYVLFFGTAIDTSGHSGG